MQRRKADCNFDLKLMQLKAHYNDLIVWCIDASPNAACCMVSQDWSSLLKLHLALWSTQSVLLTNMMVNLKFTHDRQGQFLWPYSLFAIRSLCLMQLQPWLTSWCFPSTWQGWTCCNKLRVKIPPGKYHRHTTLASPVAVLYDVCHASRWPN